MNSVYYFARYFERLAALKRDALTGADAWPAALLFPGHIENPNHIPFAFFGPMFSFIFSGYILPTSIASLRWPEDGANIALTGAYFLGLVTGVVVLARSRGQKLIHVCGRSQDTLQEVQTR